MRRLGLVWLALAAATIALPASARGFRVDAFDCSFPQGPICYGLDGNPILGDNPELPIGVPRSQAVDYIVPDSSNRFLGICTPFPAATNFCFEALNLATLGIPAASITTFPVTRGSFSGFPLLKLEWRLPFTLASIYPDLFLPFQNNPNDPQEPYNNIGVQLIFGVDPDGNFAPGNGFWLTGLADYQYSSAFNATITGVEPFDVLTVVRGDIIWSGATEACDTFSNQVLPCLLVPEPSSVALLGLGFLALVVGLRTGKPARMHLA